MVEVIVEYLIWDDWNINHIKKHQVKVEEVRETVKSKTKTLKSYQKRILILGRTEKKRLLTVVLAKEKKNNYYVVTARDMSRKERRYYHDQKNS